MDNVWQLLGAIAGTSVIATVVAALFNRRKLSAETIEVIDRAAGSAVLRTEADNARLRAEVAETREREERLWVKSRELEHENVMLIDALRTQVHHSGLMAAEIRRLGGAVPDPPTLPAAWLDGSQNPATAG